MLRLPVHPALRWLLPLLAFIWIATATRTNHQHNRGFLTSIAANVLSGPRVSTSYTWEQQLMFYLVPNGSFDIATPYSEIGREQLNAGNVFATVTVDWRSRPNYGVIYTPLRRQIVGSEITWTKDFPRTTPTTVEELENAIAHYRSSLWSPTISDEELQHLFDTGLVRSVFMRRSLPLLMQSRSIWSIETTHLIGDLAFLALIAWWLLTLRYARRLWPKPDGSRCASCGYPTAGLATPACPECGNFTQTHGS